MDKAISSPLIVEGRNVIVTEVVAKSLDLPLVVSDDFANAYGGKLKSLGNHQLRGLDLAHELFTPPVV